MPLLLTTVVFLPALGAIVLALLPVRDDRKTAHWTALVFTLLTLALSFVLFANFDTLNREYQFVDHFEWIPSLGISYFLGVDGLSLPLVVLNALLTFLAVLVSWRIDRRTKLYFSLLLALETGVMGVFTALDLFLFFLFWEVELAPMYLLIAVWGSGRKEYSAMKFLIYTIAGSAAMLVGILIMYFAAFPA
ncbi:MAG: hypothetical protein HY331_12920, partial [Chloroflexi bacterium]|nr:hypothetical protein [Chloroflexota bacterium]